MDGGYIGTEKRVALRHCLLESGISGESDCAFPADGLDGFGRELCGFESGDENFPKLVIGVVHLYGFGKALCTNARRIVVGDHDEVVDLILKFRGAVFIQLGQFSDGDFALFGIFVCNGASQKFPKMFCGSRLIEVFGSGAGMEDCVIVEGHRVIWIEFEGLIEIIASGTDDSGSHFASGESGKEIRFSEGALDGDAVSGGGTFEVAAFAACFAESLIGSGIFRVLFEFDGSLKCGFGRSVMVGEQVCHSQIVKNGGIFGICLGGRFEIGCGLFVASVRKGLLSLRNSFFRGYFGTACEQDSEKRDGSREV